MAAGIRERKKRETWDSLRHAALRLSIENGIATVTVDQIARAADVSKRTFFNHFSCKEEAIVAGHTAPNNRLLAELLRERPQEEPVMEALRAASHVLARADFPRTQEILRERLVILRHIYTSPELLPYTVTMQQTRHEPELTAAIAERAGRDPRKDMECALLASMMLTARRVALTRWIGLGDTPNLEDYLSNVDKALTRLSTGFGTLSRRQRPVKDVWPRGK